ncbi:hypothetical protein ACM1IS_001221 [Campylobacter jejuni]
MKLEENSQFGVMLDQSKCVGCRTCSLSCKDYKNMPVGVNFRRVFETEKKKGGGEIGQLKKMEVLSKMFLLTTLLFLAIIVLIHLVLKLVQLVQQ